MPAPDLGRLEEAARSALEAKFAAREVGLAASRRVIRASANAIRALHRNEYDRAEAKLAEAEESLAEATSALADHTDILHAGFVSDAAKEFAEARLTAALFAGTALPLPEEIGVGVAPYLNGLGEAVGELRRRLLDRLRSGEAAAAEEAFASMEAIQEVLETMDYPDAMTGGLRRTTDVARSLIERSRADLTTTLVQERLGEQLRRAGGT